MKRTLLILSFNFLVLFLNAQIMWQIKKDTVIKWYYFDGDEFNGPTIDQEKWIPAYSWSQLNYDFDYLMTTERLELENGICRFACYRDTGLHKVPEWQLDSAFKKKYKSLLVDGNKFPYVFTAGNVWSKKQYNKGYFEIRFKTTGSYGMWPAFWLYGYNKDEIDFFELKGEKPKQIHIDVHCMKGCDDGYKANNFLPKNWGGWIKATESLVDGYNIVSGEWQDGYVKWYLNGEGIGYYEGDFGSPGMNLIIGTGPAKDGKGFAPGVTRNTVFPNSLDVDYVRVWYKSDSSKATVLGARNTKFSYYKNENPSPSSLKKKINFMYNKRAFKQDLLTVSILPAGENKYIISSLGKSIDYTISVYKTSGEILVSKQILSSLDEITLPKEVKNRAVKLKITTSGKEIEEIVTLK